MKEYTKSYFTTTISTDFFRLICGDVIGYGVGRTVYECEIRPDLVVKIETPSHSFQNQAEWRIWSEWRYDADMKRWLAPCEAISPCGTVLLQKRTEPFPADAYPKKLPKFLTDTKRSNFGMFEKRVVCHDYALVVTTLSTAMVKADWWK